LGRHSGLLLAPFGEGQLLVDSSDQEIGRTVFIRGEYERIYMQTVVSYLRFSTDHVTLGKMFVDVGANIGISTIDALQRFGFSDAVCFEPDGRNFRLLKMNLLLNDLETRVHPHCLALSNCDGEAVLSRSQGNSGDSRLSLAGSEASGDGLGEAEEVVACRRLDSLVAEGAVSMDRVGLLWIDAQGHDAFVLDGASTAIKAGIPTLVEYWPEGLKASGSTALLEELIRAHYRRLVDIRLLSQGVEAEAVMQASEVDKLRNRYREHECTDLLLVP
jgi:FkbM family methyltransferase